MNKVVHKAFLLWDWEKEAAWLNEMSRRGWQLKRVGWCSYEFEPGEPGRWQYQLEMLQKDDPDYLAFLEDTGIQVVGRLFSWVYLRRENDGTPFELFSDTDSILRHMDRAAAHWLPKPVSRINQSLDLLPSALGLENHLALVSGVVHITDLVAYKP